MTFPETRLTFIRRLAQDSGAADWQQFVDTYWRPILRFARQWGAIQHSDAEDIASSTFEVLIRNKLLAKWSEHPNAKLRTLLCAVVRMQIANHHRKKSNQESQSYSAEQLSDVSLALGVTANDRQAFDVLWLDEIISLSLSAMRERCLKEGRINQFRVLFGRICDNMSHAEVAACLGIPQVTAELWYRQARDQVAESLRKQVSSLVRQYAQPAEYDAEFRREWEDLSAQLKLHGGLESAIRRSYEALNANSPDAE
jgi:RNA polymerase sigma factor (sigma-70 family)